VEEGLWGDHILSILGFNLVRREILSSFGGNPKAWKDTYDLTNSKFVKPIKILAFSRGESKDGYGTTDQPFGCLISSRIHLLVSMLPVASDSQSDFPVILLLGPKKLVARDRFLRRISVRDGIAIAMMLDVDRP